MALGRATEEDHGCSAFPQLKPELTEGNSTPPLGRLFCAWNQTNDRRSDPRKDPSHVIILVRGSECKRGFLRTGPDMRSAPEKTGGERFVLGKGKSLGAERRITDPSARP